MEEIDVSIIVPCYNHADYLPQCLRSLINQKDITFEILVCEGGSTDHSREIAEFFADKYPEIIKALPAPEKNIGTWDALNRGLSAAKGRYIARLDSDDLAVPNRFSIMLSKTQEFKADGAFSNYIEIKKDENPELRPYTGPINIIPTPVLYEHNLKNFRKFGGISTENGGYLHTAALIIETELAKRLRFNPPGSRIAAFEDFDFAIRALQEGILIGIDAPLMCYRRGSTSGTYLTDGSNGL